MVAAESHGALHVSHGMPSRRHSGDSVLLEATRGATASAVAAIVSNPIDIVRVRLQLCNPSGRALMAGPLTAGLGPAMAYNVRCHPPCNLFRCARTEPHPAAPCDCRLCSMPRASRSSKPSTPTAAPAPSAVG